MSDVIAREANDLVMGSDEALVSLYEITIGSSTLYFHSENTENTIEFDGNTYIAFPILIEGIDITSEGAQGRPSVTIPNVESVLRTDSTINTELGITDFSIDDLIGERLTRRQTLSKYIDQTGTEYEFPKAIYIIDRIASKNQLAIQLELASPFDLAGARVPSRPVAGKYCPWVYKQWSSSNTDVRSACYWKSQKIQGNNTPRVTPYLFFTLDDEPLILSSEISPSTWSSSTNYNAGDFVTHDSLTWQANVDNTNKTPYEGSIYWKICRLYTGWVSNGSYTLNAVDARKSSYVFYSNEVWRLAKSHTSSASTAPSPTSKYWIRADVCGKLLSSCKARYQAIFHSSSSDPTHGFSKSDTFDTEVALPFGGFPGTRKFR